MRIRSRHGAIAQPSSFERREDLPCLRLPAMLVRLPPQKRRDLEVRVLVLVGAGVGEHFPALARLGAAYMQEQIDAWKRGQRPPGPLGLMQGIATKLSRDDISAVAQYYAQRPASAATP